MTPEFKKAQKSDRAIARRQQEEECSETRSAEWILHQAAWWRKRTTSKCAGVKSQIASRVHEGTASRKVG